jgi:hypothetical protein
MIVINVAVMKYITREYCLGYVIRECFAGLVLDVVGTKLTPVFSFKNHDVYSLSVPLLRKEGMMA